MAADDDRNVGDVDNHQSPPESEATWKAFVELVAALDACASGDAEPSLEPATQGELRLGRFLIRDELGRGGFGIVLRAFDPLLEREVALKLPHPARLLAGHSAVRFLAEAQASAALVHPGIIRVYETGRIGPIWYIVSELGEGPSLANWLAENAPVSTDIAAELVAQVSDAVQHAHSRGILHRDLKSANILLHASEDGKPVAHVGDFGLSSRSPDAGGLSSRTGMAGTIAYMAPEQTWDDQSQVETATDVYALGVILFELLTADVPFAAEGNSELIEQIRIKPAPRLRTYRDDIPRDLDAICARCLAKDAAKRYDSAASLARDLRRFLAGECVDARPVGVPHRTWQWCKRRPAIASLIAALLLAVICGGAVSLRQWQRAENNLKQAEAAVVSLGWAIDDSTFWHNESDQYGIKQREELTRYYVALLPQLSDHSSANPVQAAANCFFARLNWLDREFDTAHQHFDRSISQWHEVVEGDPTNLLHRRALAKTLLWYGIFQLSNDQLADGMYHVEQDCLFGQFAASDSVGRMVISDYANILYEKAEAFREKHRDAEAAKYYSACIEVCRSFSATGQSDADVSLRMLQSSLRMDAVHRPGASREGTYRTRTQVAEALRKMLIEYPTRNDIRMEHASTVAWLATHDRGAVPARDSEDFLAEALESFEILLAKNDCPPAAKRDYGDILRFKSLRLLERGKQAEAMECAAETLVWHDRAELDGVLSALPHANSCRVIGGIYLECGANSKAIGAFERACKLYEAACGSAPRNRGLYLQHAEVWAKLARLYENDGRIDEAIEASKHAVSVLERWRGAEPAESHVASQLRRLRSIAARLQADDETRR